MLPRVHFAHPLGKEYAWIVATGAETRSLEDGVRRKPQIDVFFQGARPESF